MAAVFLYFLIAGAATVMLGPALPLLSARWRLPDAQLGTLFIASFLGQLLGAWFATHRLGLSLLGGALCSAIGCLGLAYSGFFASHVALFVIGLGLGAGLTAGNVMVGTIDTGEASVAGDKRYLPSRLLALLNAGWGIGAVACPLLLRLSLHPQGFASIPSKTAVGMARGPDWFFLLLAMGLASSALLIATVLPRNTYGKSIDDRERGKLPPRALWVFVATLAIYVGVENSLGGWLPTYGQRTISAGSMSVMPWSVSFLFWAGLLGGRGLMALLPRRIDERLVYRTGLVVLILTTGILILKSNLTAPAVFTLTVVAAMSLSPLYPLAISFMLSRTGNHRGLGRIFACGSLGGASLPWLTGIVSTYFQALRIGLAVPATGAILLLLLSFYLPPVTSIANPQSIS